MDHARVNRRPLSRPGHDSCSKCRFLGRDIVRAGWKIRDRSTGRNKRGPLLYERFIYAYRRYIYGADRGGRQINRQRTKRAGIEADESVRANRCLLYGFYRVMLFPFQRPYNEVLGAAGR